MDNNRDIKSLWAAYHQNGNIQAFNCLINHYMPIVISTARRIHRRTGLGSLGDLVDAGIWILWGSIEIYRMPQTTEFTKYARRKIRGEMIDAVKKGAAPMHHESC
ncbi:MAG: hypothetical protein IH624_12100 [Phycisphaerae bacterium]|nr:hypothetical protein [Phycisphaerae bacterium]